MVTRNHWEISNWVQEYIKLSNCCFMGKGTSWNKDVLPDPRLTVPSTINIFFLFNLDWDHACWPSSNAFLTPGKRVHGIPGPEKQKKQSGVNWLFIWIFITLTSLPVIFCACLKTWETTGFLQFLNWNSCDREHSSPHTNFWFYKPHRNIFMTAEEFEPDTTGCLCL